MLTRAAIVLCLRGLTARNDLVLRLFGNDVRPDFEENFFTQPNFLGYSPIPLDPARWREVQNEGEPAIVYPQQIFRSTSPQPPENVYGYYVSCGDVIVGGHRFSDGPYKVENNGHQIKIDLQIGGSDNDDGDE
ncbi:MAG TPA: hypothetical protein VK797_23040 [Tepidisphaeraceae bacterium]|jgi:hypothetical protein|nr:hypothetical protein [Tepidisphaeraceae bacterium]